MVSGVIAQHQENIDRLKLMIESDDITRDGNEVDEVSFMLWSAHRWLQSADDPPSVSDLQDGITDGPDDQGLDLYYVDDDERRVYLIQSKFRSASQNVQRPEFDSFLDVPAKLMDSSSLSSIRNYHLKEFAYRFRELIDHEYRVTLVYLTTERVTNRIEAARKRWNQLNLQLGKQSEVNHRAEIVDVDVLLSTMDEDEVTADIRFEEHYVSQGNGNSPWSVHGMISGTELVQLFRRHGFAMFRENPRGPLGPGVKVNSQIIDTLQSDDDRHRFHILNNGLTAVCKQIAWNERARKGNADGFQIVNGCQTTYTIYAHSLDDGVMDGVLVPMKLIESKDSSELRAQISRTSNAQSKMTDWDFLSNVPLQRELQRQFEQLVPPIFTN